MIKGKKFLFFQIVFKQPKQSDFTESRVDWVRKKLSTRYPGENIYIYIYIFFLFFGQISLVFFVTLFHRGPMLLFAFQ